jgi:hypothetical protein
VQLGRDIELAREHVASERALLVPRRLCELVAQSPPQRDQLVCSRSRLPDFDQQVLDRDEHVVTVAARTRERELASDV